MRIKKGLFFLLIIILLGGTVIFPGVTFAEDDGTITSIGIIYGDEENFPISIVFTPNGGPVSGITTWEGEYHPLDGCLSNWTKDYRGNFSGGDGGEVSGTFIFNGFDCADPDDNWVGSGTWRGNLFANGTGTGTLNYDGVSDEWTWQITFSPEAFAAGLGPTITREYIFTTYGISVEDSFGDDGWAQKAWSDQELGWLDDVLKVIPSHLIERMALKRIVRNEIEIDDGQPRPDTMGLYTPCDRSVDPGCDGSSATIRIFDRAYNPVDFPNDPERQFKATILHELVHAMQNHKGKNEIYPNVYNSPLVQNYMDATRQILDIEHPDYASHNGWRWYGAAHGWRYTNDTSSQPATSYGGTDPVEDMAEAVMMYVYEPERLQRSSWQRYYFIRDEMFGGVEYENGHPKP